LTADHPMRETGINKVPSDPKSMHEKPNSQYFGPRLRVFWWSPADF
jgi:hypothetical protein